MEQSNEPGTEFCLSCLSTNNERKLNLYTFQSDIYRDIFQSEEVNLCYICYKIAQKSERFIQNVQTVKKLLQTVNDVAQLNKTEFNPIIELTGYTLDSLELNGDTTIDIINNNVIVYSSKNESTMKIVNGTRTDLKVKIELCDDGEYLEHLEGEFIGDTDFETTIKEEDYPLKLLKEELELDDVKIECFKTEKKKSKLKNKSGKKRIYRDKICEEKDAIKIGMVLISREQCMDERMVMASDKQYCNSIYQCKDCIKGFSYKGSYEKHMEKHSESNGDYECDICKQRMPTENKLKSHNRYHTQRFKCLECGLTRISRLTIKDHYTAMHCHGFNQYTCPHCPKSFKRQVSLRKHIVYLHKRKEKVQCPYCNKSYACKQSLKAHCIVSHPKEVSGVKRLKKHTCGVCEMAFASPSQLRNHSIKHSLRKDYYCVECDKSFKSDSILKHHLKTATPHVNYLDLPLACPRCEKRFAIRRDLDRHVNRVHLNIKPYQCDQCERAYINSWSLNEHRRLAHEGYKRPLRFPCTLCDRVFDRNQILKSHIRTHTGERPFQCSRCPAQFSQASVLGTHVKLIHLKLTRDGRPKPIANIK